MRNLLDNANLNLSSPATRLAEFMSEISEDCYCAGWLIGCEFELWALANGGGGWWGMDHVTQERAARLLALSAEAGGWVIWKDGVGAVFVPMGEWTKLYAEETQ